MPADDAAMSQVKVTVVDEPIGPEVDAQVTPLTPVIDHEPVPVGVAPPVAPAIEAVKVKVEPKAAIGVLVVTVTVGVILVIAKVKALDGPVLV